MLDKPLSLLVEAGAVASIILLVLYIYFEICYSYWKKRGIPTLKPTGPFGNFSHSILSGKNPGYEMVKLYNAFDGHTVGGVYKFGTPSLLLRHPDVIKDILVKDFDHFYSRGRKFDEEAEPLDAHLFSLSGSKWRNLRVRFTPLFTTLKMKMMIGTVLECGKNLQNCLQKPASNGETIEIKDYLARYSTDVISSCAFGIECNCLKNPDAEFRKWGRKILEPNVKQRITAMLNVVCPSLVSALKLSLFPKEVCNYFRRMVRETVEYRETYNVHRQDFMQLMIQLKNKTLVMDEGEELKYLQKVADNLKSMTPFEVTMDVIAAQAFVFYLAGFETSSTTMTFCLYELARNPDIQERVRNDIDTVLQKHDGNITYEAISEMGYLNKVVSETLRMYPAVVAVTRECTKPITLRGTDVTVEKGLLVLVPILALHYDPKYYPDPERFDPERFSEEEKKKRPHFCYLPFGEGPRICIGMRFGLLQTKVGLISLLSRYEVRVSEKTPIPLVFDSRSVVLAALGGMWLTVVKRSDK
jgi:cytochrome P450 family 6